MKTPFYSFAVTKVLELQGASGKQPTGEGAGEPERPGEQRKGHGIISGTSGVHLHLSCLPP